MAAKAREIRFADFVEETLAAVIRAVEAQSNEGKKPLPTVHIGYILVNGKIMPGPVDVQQNIKEIRNDNAS